MILEGNFRVLDKFSSAKGTYLTLNDTDLGGQTKLAFNKDPGVEIDKKIHIVAEIKPIMFNNNVMLRVTRVLEDTQDKESQVDKKPA
jgi:hypothetical protein